MSLPEIVLPNPVITPAIAEVVYPNGYIVRLELGTQDTQGNQQDLRVVLRPYNLSTATLYPSADEDIGHDIPDLWGEVQRVPLLAQTMSGIVTVINLLIQEKTLIQQLGTTTSEEDKATIKASLDSIQSQLGVTPD